jgi:leucyl-tRNA synthetase
LIDGLDQIESGWPQHVLKRQRDWIGRSKGANVDFEVIGAVGANKISVFTTRIDTIFGVNALVLAAEHPVVEDNFSKFDSTVAAKIEALKAEKLIPSEHDAEPEKDGVDTGLRAINPFNREEIPVWVGNYVLMEYGTGTAPGNA